MSTTKIALLSCCILALGFAAQADDIVVPAEAPAAAPAPASLPGKGQTMGEVVKRFGQPQIKHTPAGGDSPKHPPITRWDYAGFSVFFEHQHVVDAVVPGHPAPITKVDELKPAQ